MFDTMIFNRILDGNIPIADVKAAATVYVTHIQRGEILNTKSDRRRQQLLETFTATKVHSLPTRSGVVGIMVVGESVVGTAGLYEPILRALDQMNNAHRNNRKDALIAEAAIIEKLALVTEEENLRMAAEQFGAHCILLKDLLTQQ